MIDLFDQNNQSKLEFDPNKDYIAELTGPGGKFHDADEKLALQKLAFGKLKSDEFIDFKNREFDQLNADFLKVRDENVSQAKLQEIIDRLATMQNSSNENTLNVNEDVNKPALKLEDVEGLFSKKYEEFKRTEKELDNFNKVQAKLKERYGLDYKSALSKQMDELGLDGEYVNDLAKKSPNAFFKTFGLDKEDTQSFDLPPKTQRRTDGFAPTSKEKRTWSYYQKLRKEKPDVYRDPKTQTQMLKDSVDLGEAFRDGDYYTM